MFRDFTSPLTPAYVHTLGLVRSVGHAAPEIPKHLRYLTPPTKE
jgi:hypothetical protein